MSDEKKQKIVKVEPGVYLSVAVPTTDGGDLNALKERRQLDAAVAEFHAKVERSRLVAKRRDEVWGLDNGEQMRRLCAGFPSLAGEPGTDPWDAIEFLGWLLGPAPGSGAWQAGLFVLSVWNCHEDWYESARENGFLRALEPGEEAKPQSMCFSVSRAFGIWDEAHRAAFLAWAELPFFP